MCSQGDAGTAGTNAIFVRDITLNDLLLYTGNNDFIRLNLLRVILLY